MPRDDALPRPDTDTTRSRHAILPLVLDGVSFAAGGTTLLREVSFTLPQGGCTAVLGPNGAGKSLLLRLAHGLLTPSAGRVLWNGPGATDPRQTLRAQAMVFQRPVLLRRSVRANLAHALAARGIGGGERAERINAALALAALGPLADRPARVLSGGEQARVAMARALALAPEVLFLDEPSASLDPTATRAIEALIAAACDRGTTVLLVTHDLGQARRLGRRVLFMAGGRLVEDTPAERFFTRPDSEIARAFQAGELLA